MSTTITKKKTLQKGKPDSDYLKRLKKNAEQWTDDMTQVDFLKNKDNRMFTAASYQAAADEFMEWILKAHNLTVKDLPVTVGTSKLEYFDMAHKTDMERGWGFLAPPRVLPHYSPVFMSVNARGRILGRVSVDGDIRIPRLTHPRCQYPWMSYTFSEVLSLRPGVRAAKGNVLIGGLGMGWMVREVMRKKGVGNVTIVERCPHIAAFFGVPFIHEFGPRVRVVVDDAFDYAERQGHMFDRILMDIWHDYGNQDDPKWRKLVDKFEGTKTKLWQWA